MAQKQKSFSINNDIYLHYGDRWYTAKDDPVALLRSEARTRNNWIISEIAARFPGGEARVLDIGCGAGFLANELALRNYQVTGVDSSQPALDVARRHDTTGTVDYRYGDACRLELDEKMFDVVCALDFLEHVENPRLVVKEASGRLRLGGLFFAHTFNRNLLSWLVVIKGVEWFIRNTPPRMHCLRYFIKPRELRGMCRDYGIDVLQCRGLTPKVFSAAFWKTVATGTVDDDFTFCFVRHTTMGYIALGVKNRES